MINQENNEVKTLIAKAARLIGSEYKLAQALGLDPQTVSGWKAGRRTCTAPDRARLAAMANEDAVQELVRATLTATKGTLRGKQLAAVLGKWLPQTGGATRGVLLSLHSLDSGTVWSVASEQLLRSIKRCFIPPFSKC